MSPESLHEAARRAGAHRWWELAVWEALGAWASAEDDPAAAVMFDRHAQHAAWRAGQWWERLPVLAGVDRPGLVAPPSGAAAALAERLAAVEGTVPRLAGAYRVALPRLAARYARHRASISPAAGAPAARTLGQVEADVISDWHAGELFLQGALRSPGAVEEAAATVAGLERLALGDPAGEAAQ